MTPRGAVTMSSNELLAKCAKTFCGTKLFLNALKAMDESLFKLIEGQFYDDLIESVLILLDTYAAENNLDYREIQRETRYRENFKESDNN